MPGTTLILGHGYPKVPPSPLSTQLTPHQRSWAASGSSSGVLAPTSPILAADCAAAGSPGGDSLPGGRQRALGLQEEASFPALRLPGELGCGSEEPPASPVSTATPQRRSVSSRLDFHVASCSGVIRSIGLLSASSAPHRSLPAQPLPKKL